MTQIKTIVGLDIAKEKVDAAIRSAAVAATFANTAEGHRELLAFLKKHGVCRAVMEATGGYERTWAKLLDEASIEVVIVDPKRIRHFAKSAGRLAKNDPIDAKMIAWFGEVFLEVQSKSLDPERQELEQMVTARQGLMQVQTQIANWREHDQPAAVRKAHQALAKAVATQISRLQVAIDARVKKDSTFNKRAEIIESVPGLGGVTASGVIAFMPELGHVDDKAAAALLGVAPYDDDSAERHGERHIKGGRRKLRTLLFTPILGAATQHNPVIKAFYQRLIARGKKPKVALTACMRKLIIILNTMLAKGEKWDPQKHAAA
jgi:transposase